MASMKQTFFFFLEQPQSIFLKGMPFPITTFSLH